LKVTDLKILYLSQSDSPDSSAAVVIVRKKNGKRSWQYGLLALKKGAELYLELYPAEPSKTHS